MGALGGGGLGSTDRARIGRDGTLLGQDVGVEQGALHGLIKGRGGTKRKVHMKEIVIGGIAVILVGCAAMPIDPGAERIRLTTTEPGKECRFLGDATGSQGDLFTGPYTSNENLETGARNDIKNKAAAMGGNVVFILTQRAGHTGGIVGRHGGGFHQTNVTMSGNVYLCPQ